MIDYGDLLLAPAYSTFGVDAVLTLDDTAATAIPLTVIDKTGGVTIGPNIEIGTVLPGAVLRVSELAAFGLIRDDLDGGTISFSGNTWRIASHHPKPVPSGESVGELVLILEEA